ncbi:uncharacterized protein B0T15DRAFT_137493 [Chaetomium strumarium]|uniref:Uncharacterized protein n=1 Tax=Chaetomium strumarium TaxID=1170767 RepID=A0AAJ0GUI7_9PEZI|nr:hypothetical protein B0T15DRAFT_137493 [Chaetomium strumarium]
MNRGKSGIGSELGLIQKSRLLPPGCFLFRHSLLFLAVGMYWTSSLPFARAGPGVQWCGGVLLPSLFFITGVLLCGVLLIALSLGCWFINNTLMVETDDALSRG